VTAAVPERVRWAVDLLDPGPTDRILEIGGGPGLSAALVCERLTSGRLLAVDRSAVAIDKTTRLNADHLESGRLAVEQCALDALSVPAHSFDKAFTINVNLFWVASPDRELVILSEALRPGGLLLICYGPAGPTPARRITDAVSDALLGQGFVEVAITTSSSGIAISTRTPG